MPPLVNTQGCNFESLPIHYVNLVNHRVTSSDCIQWVEMISEGSLFWNTPFKSAVIAFKMTNTTNLLDFKVCFCWIESTLKSAEKIRVALL